MQQHKCSINHALRSNKGKTYVAFSDLCGFKQMMEDRKKAYEALNHLFSSTYELLQVNKNIKALAVSDCVVSWADDQQLESMIDFTGSLHKKMIDKRYLMKTVIDCDDFEYQNRIQLGNFQKAFLKGGAYLTAYMEHDKVVEGGIVLVKQNGNNFEKPSYNSDFWEKSKKPKGWEYFWSIGSSEDILKVIQERKESHKGKYEWLKDIYQGRYHNNPV
ncbi:MAG: hypothetical protein ACYC3B_09575 [Sedimentisphaerales bacterium]